MNEKIRELMMQAGEYAKSVWVDPTEENYVSWHDLFNEKFVELIVKEYLELGKELQSQEVTNGSDDYKSGREMGIEVFMNQIKKNFGIE